MTWTKEGQGFLKRRRPELSKERQIERMLWSIEQAEVKPGERVYYEEFQVGATNREHKNIRFTRLNEVEDEFINSLDMARQIEKFKPILEKLEANEIPLEKMFEDASPLVAMKLLQIAYFGENEKNRLDAVKTLLGLAGHSPAQKHKVERVDANMSVEAIRSILLSEKKVLEKALGAEIIDDSDKAK